MADSIQTAFAEGHGECTLMLTGESKVLYSFSNKFEADGQLFETPTPHFLHLIIRMVPARDVKDLAVF